MNFIRGNLTLSAWRNTFTEKTSLLIEEALLKHFQGKLFEGTTSEINSIENVFCRRLFQEEASSPPILYPFPAHSLSIHRAIHYAINKQNRQY